MSENKYLETVYNDNLRPITNYPSKFIKYLIKRFNLKKSKNFRVGMWKRRVFE